MGNTSWLMISFDMDLLVSIFLCTTKETRKRVSFFTEFAISFEENQKMYETFLCEQQKQEIWKFFEC